MVADILATVYGLVGKIRLRGIVNFHGKRYRNQFRTNNSNSGSYSNEPGGHV